MIKKTFIDPDVILDVALARSPFVEHSRLVLSLAENGKILGLISSNCVANLFYVLRKFGGNDKAKSFIAQLLQYLTVITIDHANVLESLASDFQDFEDGLQYFSAATNQCEYIITRNIKDYKTSVIRVLLPIDLLNLYKEKL